MANAREQITLLWAQIANKSNKLGKKMLDLKKLKKEVH